MGRWTLLLLAAALTACVNQAPPEQTPGLQLSPVRFADLPGWSQDELGQALPAFQASCARLSTLGPEATVGPGAIAGHGRDWAPLCQEASSLDPAAARQFFEQRFRPWRLSNAADGDSGLLTGYYQPEVAGSLTRQTGFEVPLYRRPPDLVDASFGAMTAGRLVDGKLEPYYSRAEIDAGALAGRGLELLWLADAIDAFFVSIQGSALVGLPDGRTLRIGVAATNGRTYVAIGRALVASGEIPADQVSLQTIRAWLRAHPAQALSVMESNPRYVFFREVPGAGPVGSAGVPLTPGRSLAVDPAYLAYGLPVYVDSRDVQGRSLQRLTLAQDSGGGIKGPLRADFDWGAGAAAEEEAGAMKSPARFYLLLPAGIGPRSPAG